MDDGERANALIKLLSSAWVHVVAAGLAQLKEIVNFKCVCAYVSVFMCVHAFVLRSCVLCPFSGVA